jgi:hypothetical protein
MTEAEKRERRALERKLSEMEEELKVSNYWFLHFFYSRFLFPFCEMDKKRILLDLDIFFSK